MILSKLLPFCGMCLEDLPSRHSESDYGCVVIGVNEPVNTYLVLESLPSLTVSGTSLMFWSHQHHQWALGHTWLFTLHLRLTVSASHQDCQLTSQPSNSTSELANLSSSQPVSQLTIWASSHLTSLGAFLSLWPSKHDFSVLFKLVNIGSCKIATSDDLPIAAYSSSQSDDYLIGIQSSERGGASFSEVVNGIHWANDFTPTFLRTSSTWKCWVVRCFTPSSIATPLHFFVWGLLFRNLEPMYLFIFISDFVTKAQNLTAEDTSFITVFNLSPR